MFPHEAHTLGSPQMNQEKENRKNLSENSVAICRPNVRSIITAFSDEERPKVDMESSQQVITHFPYF